MPLSIVNALSTSGWSPAAVSVPLARGGAHFSGGAVPLAHGDETTGPPTLAGLLGGVHLSWLAIGLVAVAVAYLTGVYRLHARGDRWPVGRTLCFLVLGLGAIALVTTTGVEGYDDKLLSVHMVQHMVLSMMAPIFLALGAPITLALRTLPRRPKTVLVAALHSRVVRFYAYPLVSYALFVVTPFVLYFTGLYGVTMRNDLVHELVHLHFIVVGCLFFWPLIGVDPLPGRWPYPARALLMFLSTPFHTVLGLTIMQSKDLVGGAWYPSLHLDWVDPHADQRVAGGILWAGGEVVSVTMLAVLVVQWMMAAEREAARIDRQLDREEAEEAAEAERAAVARAEAARATIDSAVGSTVEPAVDSPVGVAVPAVVDSAGTGPGTIHPAPVVGPRSASR